MDQARAPEAREPAARQALLRAALRAFAELGFEGAGTRAIAQAAGVNQGLIRHHFGSKEGLFRELCARGLAELQHALESSSLTAVLAVKDGAANPHLALVQTIVHALLEPGPRRDWLVRTQLEPLRRRLERGSFTAAAAVGSPSPPNDALLLAWLGAAVAPSLLAPALEAVTGKAIAIERVQPPHPLVAPCRRFAAARHRKLGPWACSQPTRASGPWAPSSTRS